MRNRITHIDKHLFLSALSNAFYTAFSERNIKSGFMATGLIPFDPNVVLSKLDVRIDTPSPPPSTLPIWESRTPSTHTDLASQSALITDRIARHQNSSPTPITSAVDQFLRGAHNIAAKLTFLQAKCSRLEEANEELSKRRRRKRTRIQTGGVLAASDGQDIASQLALNDQIEAERRVNRRNGDGSVPKKRRCKTCGMTGHNSRTCTIGDNGD